MTAAAVDTPLHVTACAAFVIQMPHAPAQHAAGARQVKERGLAGEDVVPGRQQPPLLPKLACVQNSSIKSSQKERAAC